MAGQDVDWGEVQGIVLSAYWAKPYTRYFLLNVRKGFEEQACSWLGELIKGTHAHKAKKKGPWAKKDGSWLSFNDDRSGEGPSVNIAFTLSGLDKFRLTGDTLETFPWDFRDGMTSPLRKKILADRGENDPERWEWGKWDAEPEPDLLVMLYAKEDEIAELATDLEASWGTTFQEVTRRRHPHQCPQGGHRSADELRACPKIGYRPDPDDPNDRLMREHFGFADGLSQPAIETSPRSRKLQERGDFDSIVRSGEFILGYVNERGQLPVSPSIKEERGTGLPYITYVDRSVAGKKHGTPEREEPRLDFGRNGTFLVYRQLEQHVFAFDDLIRKACEQLGYDTAHRLSDEADFRQMLAAKLIGRWDNGTPLTLDPRTPPDAGSNLRAVNNFGFADEDAYGLRCPVGAHIRRANPRDTLHPDREHAQRRNNRHRLLRRGRLYGRKTGWTAWDDDNEKGSPDGEERGLHFLCINACIESQFEFVQQSWMNTSFFGGLSDEVDPLVGVPDRAERWFTIQGAPISRRILLEKPLVTVKGGAYFFLPSRAALNYLGKVCASAESV